MFNFIVKKVGFFKGVVLLCRIRKVKTGHLKLSNVDKLLVNQHVESEPPLWSGPASATLAKTKTLSDIEVKM